MNSYKFVIGGLKTHFSDGWNWIDFSFIILSTIAFVYWAKIMIDQIQGIRDLDLDKF